MGKRRVARELALKLLYQCEFNPDDIETQIEQFCIRSGTQVEIIKFMRVLVEKVFAQGDEIDALLKNLVTTGLLSAFRWLTAAFCAWEFVS